MKQKLLFLFLLITLASFAQKSSQTIGFKENKGQIIDQNGKPNNTVKYLLNTRGLNVQLRKDGFSYDIYETKKHPIKERLEEKRAFPSLKNNDKKVPDYTLEYVFHRVDIDFVNSNPNVELVTNKASTDYDNYYNIPNKPEGVINVHQYQQITYKNIYPNIDVVFSIPKDTLKTVEYNFVVHPKGNISDIQLKFNGAKTELVDNKIKMQVRFGEMEETLPASWTEDGMSKKSINVAYSKIKKDVYGFKTANAISNKTVIIDPVPVRLWGTYFGGENGETPTSLFCKDDYIYLTGTTTSTDNIASAGANTFYYASISDYDSFLVKFNSNGTRVWSTYYGGRKADIIFQVKVSNNQNVYIVGETLSDNNISTPNSFEPNFDSIIQDGRQKLAGFFVKFDTNGERKWGTYYWGSISNLSIDSSEKIYISGATFADKKISTPNAHQINIDNPSLNPIYGYFSDGFIAKFNSDGDKEWGTYYGGLDDDYISDSQIDSNGFLYFSGITSSSNNIASINTTNTPSHSNADSFLIKFSPNGNRIWGTYFGGEKHDYAFSLGIDSNNYLYTFGWTQSLSNISTPGVFQEVYNDSFWATDNNGCIFKFNSDGDKIWGTYFFSETLKGSVSKNGDLYFTGTTSINIPSISTPNAYQEDNNGRAQAYLENFDNNGKRKWGTFYGGNYGGSTGNVSATDNNGNIYLAGTTSSSDYIATPNTHQTNLYNSGNDAYLIKFKDCESSALVTSNSPICIGNTLELKASGGTDYVWTGPNGFTSTIQNPTIPNATASNGGQYTCSITGSGGCDDTKKVDVIIGDIEAPIPNLAFLPTITGDCKTIINTIPTATDVCAGPITATTASPLSYSLPGNYTVIWEYNDGNGNTSTQNQTITITAQPLPTAPSTQTFCIQQNATINEIKITGQNIKWYDALTNGNLLANTTPLQNGITYYASQTIDGCESDRISVLINIQNTPTPTGSANQTFCKSQNPTLDTIVASGTAIQWYDIGGTLLSNSTALQDGITYYASQTENGCESTNKLAIIISLISTLPANDYAELFCDDLNDGSEKVDLSDYNSKLISNTAGYTFSYYSNYSAAENQLVSSQITNFSNFNLSLGDNKIYVRINSNTPCYAISELKLTLLSKPKITIPDVVPICENNTITIDAGLDYDTYLWSTGETSSSINVDNPGNYSVTVTNNYSTISCSSTKNFEVRQSNIATITSIDTQDWTDNQNTITVYATGAGDFEYSIDGIHFQDEPQFTNIISGQYTVHVRDKNGCGTVTDEVYLLMYPKFFTPNGDGFNDTWKIKFSNVEIGLSVKIFDRYGKLIKELTHNNDWDGRFNGQELPATDYWFVVTRANGTEYRGHFSLKR
jgi:gliding motility-associated-like protein